MEIPELPGAQAPSESTDARVALAAGAPADPGLRLEWLFRDGARHGTVNPLLLLLRMYRTGGRP